MYREASAGADPSFARVIESAGKILDSARLSYERKDFVEARAAAQQSQSFSQKILEGSAGESFHREKSTSTRGTSRSSARDSSSGTTSAANTALKVGTRSRREQWFGPDHLLRRDDHHDHPGSLLEIRELFEDPTTKSARSARS